MAALWQINPGEFKSLNEGIAKIFKAEGFAGIMRGQVPTTLGFLLQGSLKYGFYEFFKDTLAGRTKVSLPPPTPSALLPMSCRHKPLALLSPLSPPSPPLSPTVDPHCLLLQADQAAKDKAAGKKVKAEACAPKLPVPQMILAGACAEVLGTTALLPFEATRIRMVADPSFGKGMTEVMGKLIKTQGFSGLYGGLIPIMSKQAWPNTLPPRSLLPLANAQVPLHPLIP